MLCYVMLCYVLPSTNVKMFSKMNLTHSVGKTGHSDMIWSIGGLSVSVDLEESRSYNPVLLLVSFAKKTMSHLRA